MRHLRAADLFCGAGGTSSGAESSGAAKVVCAVNHWQTAVDTHSRNFPHAKHINSRNDQVEDEFNGLNNGWPDPHVEYDIHGFRENYQGADCRIRLRDPKGGDWNEWPNDLRVREWPKGR